MKTILLLIATVLVVGCGSDTYVERTSYPEPVYQPSPVVVHEYDRPRVRAHVNIYP